MATAEYLARVKRDLRRFSSDFDDEIASLIEEARQDLKDCGVSAQLAEDEDEPMVYRYISTYCKRFFGILTQEDAMMYSEALTTQKIALMLRAKYSEEK